MSIFEDGYIDPLSIAVELVKGLGSVEDYSMVDPTNPTTMLLESISVTTSGALQEMIANDRVIYPSLSRDEADRFHHINTLDEKDFFASPARTKLQCYVNLLDLLNFGITENGRTTAAIPKNTIIKVDDLILTVTDPIEITVTEMDNVYTSYVEKLTNTSSTSFEDIGGIPSVVTVDKNNNKWVVFEIPVEQVISKGYSSICTVGEPMNVTIDFEDQYYYSTVEQQVNGEWVEIPKIYSSTNFDPGTPCVVTNIQESAVTYTIPYVYTASGQISGEIRFNIMTTKGKVRSFLNKYETKDFNYSIAKITTRQEEAVMRKINLYFNGIYVLDGGNNRRLPRDVKTKLIQRGYGFLNQPITEQQLREYLRLDGFVINKAMESLTKRTYVAHKDITDTPLTSNLRAVTNIYNLPIRIEELDSSLNYNNVTFTDDFIIINEGCVIKAVNGLNTPLTVGELNTLKELSPKDLRNTLNNAMYSVTPFTLVVEHTNGIYTPRVYNTAKPKIDAITITDTNDRLPARCNINGMLLYKVDGGYDVFISLIGNEDFNAIKDNTYVQFKFTDVNGIATYFTASIDNTKTFDRFGDTNETFYYAHIENLNIIGSDVISVTNGISDVPTNDISISSISDIIIYTPDTSIVPTEYSVEALNFVDFDTEIFNPDVTTGVGFTRETATFTFMERINNLWSKVSVMYTEKRYQRYTVDVPLRYTEDVYALDPETGCRYHVIDDDGDGTCDRIEYVIEHAKGDIVYDEDGNIVYAHKVGDVIYDDLGNPLEDEKAGKLRIIDMTTVDYMYMALDKQVYADHIEDTKELIRSWSATLDEINKNTLDQTTIYYRPRKSLDDVITVDKVRHNAIVSPKVTLYLEDKGESVNVNEIELLIGTILNKYLYKQYIDLSVIEDEIENSISLSSLVGVGVSGIVDGTPKIISLAENSNRFMLNTFIDSNNIIRYNIDIEIIPVGN